MPEVIYGSTVPIKLWAPVVEVESQALTQLKFVAALPRVFHHVAAMPDVHFGIGATVGSVIAMKDALSPAAVGVDIGCGMAAVRSSLRAEDLPEDLSRLRQEIEDAVPVGNGPGGSRKAWETTKMPVGANQHLNLGGLICEPVGGTGRASMQLGTLGGGNHFIEVCLDEEDRVWIMLHSGSRNVGKQLAEYHIGIAKDLGHNQDLADRDLAFFLAGTPEMKAYREALEWAQKYAWFNRQAMLMAVKDAVEKHEPWQVTWDEPVQCHHNYVAEEIHFGESVLLTRKGAISAQKGQLGIIPGSMGTKSYIVEGLGNPESFCSASHGAGRRMSRGQARRTFAPDPTTMEREITEQLKDVECRRDSGIVDELPGAYKDIDKVMENQKDLVRVVHQLHQVLCVKG